MDGFVLILELIGTVAFAASGAIIAIRKQMDVFGVCVLALTTAVGGGILRDVMAGDTPYIFVKDVYACASLAGALVCALLWRVTGHATAMIIGAMVVMVIRALSVTFHWNLPRAD